jgi:uncharacterized protein involved in exopolysaccharide biosynthesis
MAAEGNMGNEQSIAGVVFGWRKMIYRVTIGAALIAVVVSLVMPSWYAATANCMPPQETESRGGILQMFTRMGMDFGAGGLVSGTPMSDLMIGILKSRLIRGQIVDRFDLVSAYRSRTREHAIRELGNHLRVYNTPEGLIEVWVEDRDKKRAAQMANAFLELLDEYNRTASVDQARRTSEFVERILGDNRERLENAARDLREFKEKHQTVELSEQTRVTVEEIARLESERTEFEIERGVLRNFSRPDQIEMRKIDARLREIQTKLDELEGAGASSTGSGAAEGGVFLPLSEIPALSLQLADLTREAMVQEKVYEFLSSQLEEARIQESKDLQVIRILDEAVPPLVRSRPRRKLIVILTVCLAALGSVGVALVSEGFLEYESRNRSTSSIADSRESRALVGFFRWLRRWGGPGQAERSSSSASGSGTPCSLSGQSVIWPRPARATRYRGVRKAEDERAFLARCRAYPVAVGHRRPRRPGSRDLRGPSRCRAGRRGPDRHRRSRVEVRSGRGPVATCPCRDPAS